MTVPQDPPSSAELVDAVGEFLRDELRPELEGHLAFHALVAERVLRMVARELRQGPAAEEDERRRLEALLGRGGDVEVLNEELARAIRDGSLDPGPQLVEHLTATVLDKLAITNPGYAGGRERPTG